MTWWQNLPDTGSRAGNNMQNLMGVALQTQYNNSIVEQRKAAAAEAEWNKKFASLQGATNQLISDNQAASAAAQANFDKQFAASQKAADDTLAGLNQLLLDQQSTAKAQAAQFAAESAAAEARYNEQMERARRISNAYVPNDQPTAGALTVGDARPTAGSGSKRGKTNNLSSLTIQGNNAGAGTALEDPTKAKKGKEAQLSGLQIA